MNNISFIKFKDICSKYGHLTPIEGKYDIPYDIKRVFYIHGVPDVESRGHHAHRWVYQTLICLKGSMKIKLSDSKDEEVFTLDDPSVGLMIGPWIWNEMYDYSQDCVLLVLCSDYYDEEDYIRDFEVYKKEVENRF